MSADETETPHSLSVLLAQLEERLKANGVPLQSLHPGLPPDRVRAAFNARGLKLPEELIEWFGWHDGAEPGIMPIPVLVPASLDWALERHAYDSRSPDTWGSDPDWLRIEQVPTSLNVHLTGGANQPPLVRRSDEEHPVGDTTDTTFQVKSLCTPIGWWIEDIDCGALEWRAQDRRWHIDYSRIDAERFASGMYQ